MWEKVRPDYRKSEEYNTGDVGTAGKGPGTGDLSLSTPKCSWEDPRTETRVTGISLSIPSRAIFRPHSFRQ